MAHRLSEFQVGLFDGIRSKIIRCIFERPVENDEAGNNSSQLLNARTSPPKYHYSTARNCRVYKFIKFYLCFGSGGRRGAMASACAGELKSSSRTKISSQVMLESGLEVTSLDRSKPSG